MIAEDKAPSDLDTLLRDSTYVLNRFEGLSTGLAVQIDRSYPPGLKDTCKQALSSVLRNVEIEKPALNAIVGLHRVSSVDFFDLYTEIVEVSSELEGESSNTANWGDPNTATDLAQLGAKAHVLSANIAVKLRSQVAAEDLELASCKNKGLSVKPNDARSKN